MNFLENPLYWFFTGITATTVIVLVGEGIRRFRSWLGDYDKLPVSATVRYMCTLLDASSMCWHNWGGGVKHAGMGINITKDLTILVRESDGFIAFHPANRRERKLLRECLNVALTRAGYNEEQERRARQQLAIDKLRKAVAG